MDCLGKVNLQVIRKLLTSDDELTGEARPCCFIPVGIKIHEHDASAMTVITLHEGNLTPILGSYKKYERLKGMGKTALGEATMWVSQLKEVGLDSPKKILSHVTAGCTDGAPFEIGMLFHIHIC